MLFALTPWHVARELREPARGATYIYTKYTYPKTITFMCAFSRTYTALRHYVIRAMNHIK